MVIVKAPLNKVWDAIIKPELVKQYFFGTELVTTWKIGSPIFFRGLLTRQFIKINLILYNYRQKIFC